MNTTSIKVVNVNQKESSYYNSKDIDIGTFVFEINEPLPERWKEIFHELASSYQNDFYHFRAPVLKEDNKITAIAEIEGDQDLPYTLNLLKRIVSETNNAYNREVKEQLDIKQKEDERRSALDIKVKEIIGKLDFS